MLGIVVVTWPWRWFLGSLANSGWFTTGWWVAFEVGRGLILGCMIGTSLLWRRRPGWALGLVWLCGVLGLGLLFPPPLGFAAVGLAASFGCARYGTQSTLWISAASIVAAPMALAASFVMAMRIGSPRTDLHAFESLAAAALAWVVVLVAPWLIGYSLRSQQGQRRALQQQAVYQQAHADSLQREAQAREVAELKESQARLARDVHDVVGHSLAVILAQAESAQYLPKRDLAGRDAVLANIATSARQSLQDVREVLGRTQEGAVIPARATSISLEGLIDSVRTAGNDVRASTEGTPQPLPPELDSVAYRVLQEMLTNALKHGTRGGPVWVEQHWEGDLRLEVRNVIAEPANGNEPGAPTSAINEITLPIQASHGAGPVAAGPVPPTDGPRLGLEGMRARLEAVGGRLDVRRRSDPGVGPTFTATAWMPIRAAG